MKTSNKLLFGVLFLAIAILIAANIILKIKGKKKVNYPTPAVSVPAIQNSTLSADTIAYDSIKQ